MGKKRTRKKYVSKGKHSTVSRALVGLVRKDRSKEDRLYNKIMAWAKGLNPWVTIENPSREATNKKFIRVKSNEIWGKPKEKLIIGKNSKED